MIKQKPAHYIYRYYLIEDATVDKVDSDGLLHFTGGTLTELSKTFEYQKLAGFIEIYDKKFLVYRLQGHEYVAAISYGLIGQD